MIEAVRRNELEASGVLPRDATDGDFSTGAAVDVPLAELVTKVAITDKRRSEEVCMHVMR